MGKVGIFAPFSLGDMTISTCLLRHKDTLWPGMKIVWFSAANAYDILQFNPDVEEIRPHAGHHYGSDVRIPDCSGSLAPGRSKYSDVADLDLGFYTTPWGNPKLLNGRPDIPYAFFPKMVTGGNLPAWKPCIYFSKEEDDKAETFFRHLPFKKAVMLETEARSGQSLWDQSCTDRTMEICRNTLGACNFIFASPKSHAKNQGRGVVDCSEFTARQCIPIYNLCDMFVGVSSGISCLTTAWTAKVIPRVEYCHNSRMSTCHLSPCSLCTSKEALLNSIAETAKKIA